MAQTNSPSTFQPWSFLVVAIKSHSDLASEDAPADAASKDRLTKRIEKEKKFRQFIVCAVKRQQCAGFGDIHQAAFSAPVSSDRHQPAVHGWLERHTGTVLATIAVCHN
jgi:hypothetical protein